MLHQRVPNQGGGGTQAQSDKHRELGKRQPQIGGSFVFQTGAIVRVAPTAPSQGRGVNPSTIRQVETAIDDWQFCTPTFKNRPSPVMKKGGVERGIVIVLSSRYFVVAGTEGPPPTDSTRRMNCLSFGVHSNRLNETPAPTRRID